MNPIPSASDLTRRDALKILGAGAALASLGVLPNPAAAQAPAAAPAAPQPFVLPKLGYGFDALEPHIDARTMEVHYTKHHQAYITNANNLLKDQPALAALDVNTLIADLSKVPEAIRTGLRNNAGGHSNHSFFWTIMGPGKGGAPTGALAAANQPGLIARPHPPLDGFHGGWGEAGCLAASCDLVGQAL